MAKTMRRFGISRVTFQFDDYRELTVSRIVEVRSCLGKDDQARYLVVTRDLYAACALISGATGNLTAQVHDGEDGSVTRDLGRFRVMGPPLINGSGKGLATAKIRLIEVVPALLHDLM